MSADRCPCGDRERSQCPGEWEPGCDLGNNPAHVVVAKQSADRWVLVPPSALEALDRLDDYIARINGDDRGSCDDVNTLRAALAAAPAAPQPLTDIHGIVAGAAPAAPAAEPFVVKHYSGDERPCIKGNGFDGLEVGEDRDEAEAFVRWVNARIWSAPGAAPAQSREPLTLTDEQVEAAMNPCDDSDMGRHLRREFIASFKRVYARLHGTGSQP